MGHHQANPGQGLVPPTCGGPQPRRGRPPATPTCRTAAARSRSPRRRALWLPCSALIGPAYAFQSTPWAVPRTVQACCSRASPVGSGAGPGPRPTGVCASALSGTVALSGGQVDQRVGGPVGCEQRRVDELQACHSHGVTLERSTKPRQPPGRVSEPVSCCGRWATVRSSLKLCSPSTPWGRERGHEKWLVRTGVPSPGATSARLPPRATPKPPSHAGGSCEQQGGRCRRAFGEGVHRETPPRHDDPGGLSGPATGTVVRIKTQEPPRTRLRAREIARQ